MHQTHSSYLNGYSRPAVVRRTVETMIKKIIKEKIDFDTILYTGVSGALIAIPLGYEMGKPICCVRKSKDNSHSGCHLEGELGQKCLIVDDFFSSGQTIRNIEKVVKGLSNIVGIFAYMSAATPWWKNELKDITNNIYDLDYTEVQYCLTGQFPPADQHNQDSIYHKRFQTETIIVN